MALQDFTRDRIRIEIDVSKKSDKLTDVLLAGTPRHWRGTDLAIEFALFWSEDLVDVSLFSSVTFDVRPFENRIGNLLISKTLAAADLNIALTPEQWEDGSSQHGLISVLAADTNLDLNGATQKDFWFVFSAITNTVPARQVTLGGGKLTVLEDGSLTDEVNTPALGSNLIPIGAVYDGGGHYVLPTVQDRVYDWGKNAADTSLTNGTQVLNASGTFTAQGATVTLTGTPFALITATLRNPKFFTAEESDARYLNNVARLINKPGELIEVRSKNNQWRAIFGISNTGKIILKPDPVV
jgi:hypothetical protein